ncbi:hypothetical protein KBD33_04390 [Candidatus Gracilibacteria bacterium]|nr:hypothetical protein [Candidatus Gracilibacteria bacterium]
MSTKPLSNEQKLDEIYSILKQQESRNSRARWFRLLKWSVIILGVYIVTSNPGFFLDKLVKIIQPIIMDNVKTMMNEKKDGLLDEMKGILESQGL